VRHFAINADDLQRARQFYSSVFGWKLEARGPPGFFMINAGEAADSEGNVAGAMRYERRA
jgi:hypothetical protein